MNREIEITVKVNGEEINIDTIKVHNSVESLLFDKPKTQTFSRTRTFSRGDCFTCIGKKAVVLEVDRKDFLLFDPQNLWVWNNKIYPCRDVSTRITQSEIDTILGKDWVYAGIYKCE